MKKQISLTVTTILGLLLISQSTLACVTGYNTKFTLQNNSKKQIKSNVEYLVQVDAEGDPSLYEPGSYMIPFDVPPPPSNASSLIAPPIEEPTIEQDPITMPPLTPSEDESPVSQFGYPALPY